MNPFISKSIITSSLFSISTSWLYTLYKLTILIIFGALNLILNCPSLKFTVAVYRGLPTKWPLLCVPCVPYIPIQSNNII
jgi:hypothetical protein